MTVTNFLPYSLTNADGVVVTAAAIVRSDDNNNNNDIKSLYDKDDTIDVPVVFKKQIDEDIKYYVPFSSFVNDLGLASLYTMGTLTQGIGSIGSTAVDMFKTVYSPVSALLTWPLTPIPVVGDTTRVTSRGIYSVLNNLQRGIENTSSDVGRVFKEPFEQRMEYVTKQQQLKSGDETVIASERPITNQPEIREPVVTTANPTTVNYRQTSDPVITTNDPAGNHTNRL